MPSQPSRLSSAGLQPPLQQHPCSLSPDVPPPYPFPHGMISQSPPCSGPSALTHQHAKTALLARPAKSSCDGSARGRATLSCPTLPSSPCSLLRPASSVQKPPLPPALRILLSEAGPGARTVPESASPHWCPPPALASQWRSSTLPLRHLEIICSGNRQNHI